MQNITRVFALLFYLLPLALGLNYDYFFINSPLVKYTAYVAGFCSSAISWIFAYLTAGIVFGKFDFAKQVFRLYRNTDFSIAMSLVFLTATIAWFLARIIDRAASLHLHRKIIFCIAIVFIIANLASISEYMNALNNRYVYIFSCSVMGIIYFLLFWKNTSAKKTGIKQKV